MSKSRLIIILFILGSLSSVAQKKYGAIQLGPAISMSPFSESFNTGFSGTLDYHHLFTKKFGLFLQTNYTRHKSDLSSQVEIFSKSGLFTNYIWRTENNALSSAMILFGPNWQFKKDYSLFYTLRFFSGVSFNWLQEGLIEGDDSYGKTFSFIYPETNNFSILYGTEVMMNKRLEDYLYFTISLKYIGTNILMEKYYPSYYDQNNIEIELEDFLEPTIKYNAFFLQLGIRFEL